MAQFECPRVIYTPLNFCCGVSISLDAQDDPPTFKSDHLESMKDETYICKKNFQFFQQSTCRISTKRALQNRPKSEWQQGMYDPGAFTLDYLESIKPNFVKEFSILLTSHMQHFPFPACREKGTLKATSKVNDTKECMTLGHSNRIICSPQNLFLQYEFPLYSQARCSISLFLHTVKWITHNVPKSE